MKTGVALLVAATLAAGTASAAGLTPANYVEVGDTIVDMLDTSVLAFSTMLMSQADATRPVLASYVVTAAHTQSFSMSCPGGGTIGSSMADRDASGDVSVRDRFVTVFHACRIDNETLTGSSEFVIAANRTLNGVETTELEFRFRHLGSDAMRWDGTARAGLLTATDADGDRLEVEAGRRLYRYRYYARGNRGDTPDSQSQSKPHGEP